MINAIYLEDKTPAEIVKIVEDYMEYNPGNYALTVYDAANVLIKHHNQNKPCAEYIPKSKFLASFIFDYHTVVVFRGDYSVGKVIHFAVSIDEHRNSDITWDIRVN